MSYSTEIASQMVQYFEDDNAHYEFDEERGTLSANYSMGDDCANLQRKTVCTGARQRFHDLYEGERNQCQEEEFWKSGSVPRLRKRRHALRQLRIRSG